MSVRVVIIAKGLPILWRKTFAANATIDGVIREFCSRHRLIVDTCILEHAGHPLRCGVRLDQIDASGPALLQTEASTAASLAVYVAHLLQSLPDNQGSAQWSKAIAAYSPSDTFICGSAALQLLTDAADAPPSATVTDSSFDVRLNMKPANVEPLFQIYQYLISGTEQHSVAAESPAVAVRAQADADSAEADIRCLLDLVVAKRHCREFPATKLNLPEVSALTDPGAELRQTKAKVRPKKGESVESEPNSLPISLHVFHGDKYLSCEKLESGKASVVMLEGTSPGSTVTRLRIACYDDEDNPVEGVSGSIQVSWSKDRRVARFQELVSTVSLPDLEVPLQTTGLEKHWIQFDMDNILGPPLRLNIHIQPALPSSGLLDKSAYSQTLPLEQSSRQEVQLPEANQHISSSCLASLVLVQDEEAVHIKGITPETAFLAKARAGSVLHGLAFYACDQAGQPLQDGVEGTVELSWRPGPQKAFLDHALLCLPDIQVPTRLGTTLEWIKFVPNHSPAACSQLRLIVKAVAGEPVSYCMVAPSTQTSPAAELHARNGNLPEVFGNQPFDMEVFAVDEHGNGCHYYYAWDITCLSSHTVKTLERDRRSVSSSNKVIDTVTLVASGSSGILQLMVKCRRHDAIRPFTMDIAFTAAATESSASTSNQSQDTAALETRAAAAASAGAQHVEEAVSDKLCSELAATESNPETSLDMTEMPYTVGDIPAQVAEASNPSMPDPASNVRSVSMPLEEDTNISQAARMDIPANAASMNRSQLLYNTVLFTKLACLQRSANMPSSSKERSLHHTIWATIRKLGRLLFETSAPGDVAGSASQPELQSPAASMGEAEDSLSSDEIPQSNLQGEQQLSINHNPSLLGSSDKLAADMSNQSCDATKEQQVNIDETDSHEVNERHLSLLLLGLLMPALCQAIKQECCPEDMDIVPSLCCLSASLLTASLEVAEAVADEICKPGGVVVLAEAMEQGPLRSRAAYCVLSGLLKKRQEHDA